MGKTNIQQPTSNLEHPMSGGARNADSLPPVLDDPQRREFLAAFDRKSDAGRRDYALAVCWLDLGLRAMEVLWLRVADIQRSRKVLTEPPAKESAGWPLPLPRHVTLALREYLCHRSPTEVEEVVVGQTELWGRPLAIVPCFGQGVPIRSGGGSGFMGAYRRPTPKFTGWRLVTVNSADARPATPVSCFVTPPR